MGAAAIQSKSVEKSRVNLAMGTMAFYELGQLAHFWAQPSAGVGKWEGIANG